nr:putative reverse transcriptase domain-containing protein [Tanacetum cinerariifolium]
NEVIKEENALAEMLRDLDQQMEKRKMESLKKALGTRLDMSMVYHPQTDRQKPEEIMDHEVKKLKRSRILIVKVRWNSKRRPEFTWENVRIL